MSDTAEVDAIAAVCLALGPLNEDARRRVLNYVWDRFHPAVDDMMRARLAQFERMKVKDTKP